MGNPYGDIELDAQGMRALAHPVRLAILTRLQQRGPSTATGLSEHVGASPSVASWHLRHLAKHGLVRDAEQQRSGRERWWEAAARGIRFVADDEASRSAYRALRAVIESAEGDLVGEWERDVEPHLEQEWAHVAGRANTTVLVTPAEAAEIESAIEQVLAPYVLRKDSPDDTPEGTRTVRILRYTMPEAAGTP
ncbi:metalloregulator ArsR/SmtB family transcription factor [Luteipulveratus sp. YIM 133132]|uniref:ArsR/SmtB family transcription factor n=1 Tax=Luteipulveratus flavus TaxID=3031728 RepID=UPI0023AF8904|nr:metalloregulator ArsR/SmtB family transcription factor [Luteipulveratus sp. YIM 133132]MDE9365069.1 metalloregulator ArsR/SmtB family transcription factor [Luteipulveratus sp. YIM 133132]